MEITVDVKDVHKLVRLDVDKSHTVAQVVDEIIESLDLPKNKRYILECGSAQVGPERYQIHSECDIADSA